MTAEKFSRLRKLIEDHERDAEQRRIVSCAEFYARLDSVYFGYPNAEYGRAITKDGRLIDFQPVLIAKPGSDAAKGVADALNRVLQPCRAREKMVAREAALQFQADIAQLAEELANREIAEINAANLIETKTEVCEAAKQQQAADAQNELLAAANPQFMPHQ